MKKFFDVTLKGLALVMMAAASLLVACGPDDVPEPNTGSIDVSQIDPSAEWPLISTIPSFVSAESTEDILVVLNVADSAIGGGEELYAHTGVITNKSTSGGDWKYVKHDWTENEADCKLTYVGGTIYAMCIKGGPRAFYNVPEDEHIVKMAFVFRNAAGTKEVKNNGQDIYVELTNADELAVSILSPAHGTIFPVGASFTVKVVAQNAVSVSLALNGTQVKSVEAAELEWEYTVTAGGDMLFEATATNADGESVVESVIVAALKDTTEAPRPAGAKDGVTVEGDKATVVLYAPGKEQVVLLGDFNRFAPNNEYVMFRDGDYFWTTISGLQPDTEYAYQFLVDGKVKVGDPYCEKILDPWNDKYITSATYPNLMSYPANYTTEIVSVFSTTEEEYNWQVPNFDRPDKNSLAIYELLLRDFSPEGNIDGALAHLDYLEELGVNAIELMPIQEFDGNNSWGYNPCFYFAPDKAYGTKNDYKLFIDECHKRGMAVILDIVLNHATGQFPWLRMWENSGYPSAENPFFNVTAKHPHNVYNDINHNFPKTREYFKDMLRFWIEEYKVDGYRFDLAKGITQTNSGTNDGVCQQYDANRVEILKEYADAIKEAGEDCYIILEYFVCDKEENEMATYGALPWRNSISGYQQSIMGWTDPSSYFGRAYAKDRVSYMESHDEDRVAYKAITWGNNGVKDWANLSKRIQAAMAMHFLTPYPKMMWQGGELGDDRELTSEGRTDPKPFRWDDLSDPNRKAIYDAASKIISFRTSHPELYGDGATNSLNIYRVSDSDMGGKHLVYTSGGSTVMVAANFREAGSNPSVEPSELVYTEPSSISSDMTEDVYVFVNTAGTTMDGFSGDMYAHTGVLTNKSTGTSDWKYVKHEWTVNADDCKLTKEKTNLWKLKLTGGPRKFYGVPAGETIQKLAFVFRNSDGTKELKDNGQDIFIDVAATRALAAAASATATTFSVAMPDGNYTNLITGESVVVSGGSYQVSLEPHNYIVLVKTN